MGKTKNVPKKKSADKQKSIPLRVTRAKAKQLIETENLKSTKIDRVENSKNPSANLSVKKLDKINGLVKLPQRFTRSKIIKSPPPINIQPEVPSVESTKRIVKRVDFVKLATFKKKDIILAKQKYSIPWPARILDIEKEKVTVFFFGDRRTGSVSSTELYDYVKSYQALKSHVTSKKKPRGFITGIREVELLLGIAEKDSVLKHI